MKVNEEMTMGEVLAANPQARVVLEGFGMHCCGCPVSQAEPLGDACAVHGIDVKLVLKELEQLADPCACGPDCDCGPECDCTTDTQSQKPSKKA